MSRHGFVCGVSRVSLPLTVLLTQPSQVKVPFKWELHCREN